MTPDVNVLVAAARRDHPHHDPAREWLESALKDAPIKPLVLLPMVIASFLRLVTHPKIFVQPSPVADAIKFIDTLLAHEGVHLEPVGTEWLTPKQFIIKGKLSANAIPDAWIAAAVLELGERLVTFDRDFRRLLPRASLSILSATTS